MKVYGVVLVMMMMMTMCWGAGAKGVVYGVKGESTSGETPLYGGLFDGEKECVVRIFDRNVTATIESPLGDKRALFGVALSPFIHLAVGAPKEGKVYVYSLPPASNAPTLLDTVSASVGFGTSVGWVGIGSRMVVGDPNAECNPKGPYGPSATGQTLTCGAMYLYDCNTLPCTLAQSFQPDVAGPGSEFGSVMNDGGKMVGAPCGGTPGGSCNPALGMGISFSAVGSQQSGYLQAVGGFGATPADPCVAKGTCQFGTYITSGGGVVAVTAPGAEGNGSGVQGAVYTYVSAQDYSGRLVPLPVVMAPQNATEQCTAFGLASGAPGTVAVDAYGAWMSVACVGSSFSRWTIFVYHRTGNDEDGWAFDATFEVGEEDLTALYGMAWVDRGELAVSGTGVEGDASVVYFSSDGGDWGKVGTLDLDCDAK